ncbi:MAG: D-glycero-beta-D-manno-heptose-7-phosphate kinase [Rhodocyclaceae bacterium]|nr:D-glycero-beta-D-manno-heptose-7-phosphate kinase [Rhodocyclaceae bacterium]
MPAIPDTSATRILVVGDVMLDRYWFGDVSRISPEAPVPVVLMERSEDRPGGAANVARNARALGAQVSLLAVVGEDEAAGALQRLLDADGVRASLHPDPALHTTIKLRVIGRQQQLLRIDFETRPTREVLQAKLDEYRALVGEHDLVVLSDYDKGGLTDVGEMVRIAREAGKPVLVDPKGDDFARYAGASMVTPNRGELKGAVGRWRDEADLAERIAALRDRTGIAHLLLTRSEEGMSLYGPDEVVHEAARAREVYDVSGAGDTVIATVAVMLASGATPVDAMRLANHAAGIVVGKLGTATVTLDEMRATR